MTPDDLKTMQTSTDSAQLQKTALALARSTLADDHAQLLKFLRSEEFLLRLDTAAAYQAAAAVRLRISRILEALGNNAAPTARAILVGLCQDPVFLKDAERVEFLLEATTVLRPPPPEVVTFWDKYFQPEDTFTPTTITVLVDNGSAAALVLLEKKMQDPAQDQGNKIAWMHTRILSHRNDLPLLESCERMLKRSLPENLRPDLVESLFDYKPTANGIARLTPGTRRPDNRQPRPPGRNCEKSANGRSKMSS